MSNGSDVPFSATAHVRDTCLCLHAQRAARTLARRFDEALRPLGLTNRQFSLMMSLNRPEPPSMRPVAQLLAMDRTTLTAALKPLEKRGWVSVEPDPQDRRGRRLRLTAEGRTALASALPVWTRLHADIEGELEADPDMLRKGLVELSG